METTPTNNQEMKLDNAVPQQDVEEKSTTTTTTTTEQADIPMNETKGEQREASEEKTEIAEGEKNEEVKEMEAEGKKDVEESKEEDEKETKEEETKKETNEENTKEGEEKSPEKVKKTRTPKKKVEKEENLDSPGFSRSGRTIKSVERFHIEENKKEKKGFEVSEGKGVKLGDMEHVKTLIDKRRGDDDLLKKFHAILYQRPGKSTEVKSNLRNFQGLVYQDEEKERAVLKTRFDKWVKDELKELCEILDLEKGGDKDAVIERIIVFLEEPKSTRKTKTPTKPSTKKTPTKAKSPSKTPTKSKTKTPTKPKTPSETTPKRKNQTKEESSTKKAKTVDEDDEEDNKPLALLKKVSDEEIKEEIISLLKTADLEQVTKKKVREDLSRHFGVDLTDRKEFINQTIDNALAQQN